MLRSILGLAVILTTAACGSSATGMTAPTTTTYAMTGTVRVATADGLAVDGASVRLLEASVVGNPTMSDANGNFRLPALLDGEHLIEVSKTGFVIWETEFSIAGHDLQLNVVLQSIDPSPATIGYR